MQGNKKKTGEMMQLNHIAKKFARKYVYKCQLSTMG